MQIQTQLEQTRKASQSLNLLETDQIDKLLRLLAQETVAQTDFILRENKKDLNKMDLSDPKYDRLRLTAEQISGIAADMEQVASLPSPLGHVLKETVRPNGLLIRKISVSFGVIGIIYEARPNVTFDVFSLCLKSGNACILKGGSDALHSNEAIVSIIQEVLTRNKLDPGLINLLPPNREATTEFLQAREYVDLLIPRGSQQLIDYVRTNASIPVIETGAGICHTYFDEFGNLNIGQAIINNAKTRRPSVCNSLDCLIIHKKRVRSLTQLCGLLPSSHVVIYADEPAYKALEGRYPEQLLKHADNDSFGTEFLDYKMAIKTVNSFKEALDHIARYGSKHSEAIITDDNERMTIFKKQVDAAAVYCNASTAFTDGAQFGLGAEIGISTQKLHARGPMGLEELTSYKWIIEGDGQIRHK